MEGRSIVEGRLVFEGVDRTGVNQSKVEDYENTHCKKYKLGCGGGGGEGRDSFEMRSSQRKRKPTLVAPSILGV